MDKSKIQKLILKENTHSIGNLPKFFLDKAIKTVNKAFINYPLTDYFFSNINFSKRVNLYHANYILKSALSYGNAFFTGENVNAVLTGFHSADYELSNWQMIKAGCLFLPFKIGIKTLSRIREFNDYSSRIRRRNAPDPHYFITTLAVAPAFQNMGYGNALMNYITRLLDIRELPAYLETHTEKNAKYYERFGFCVVDKTTVPGTILEHYSMVRNNE